MTGKTTKSRTRITTSLFAVVLIVLSAIVALIPMGIVGDEADEESLIWGNIVWHDLVGANGVESGTVYLYNVHTGEQYSYEVNDEYGSFEFVGHTGYFILEVEPVEPASPVQDAYLISAKSRTDVFEVKEGEHKGPKFKFYGETDKDYLTLEKVPSESRETFYVEGFVKNKFGSPVAGATVTLKCTEFPGLEITVLTEASGNMTGHYNITSFNSTYKIWATLKGYNYTVVNIVLNQNHRNQNITIFQPDYTVRGQVLGEGSNDIKNVDYYLFDVNSDDYIKVQGSSGLFKVKVYKGTFSLVIDAEGYEPYIHEQPIVITDTNKGASVGDVTLMETADETLDTTITFVDNDWNTTEITTKWALNSDSKIYGLKWVEVGNPRFQIDKQFGNGDLTVDTTEMQAFINWLKDRGPYRLYTEGFMEVNDTYYNPVQSSFVTIPSGFTGAFDASTTMHINTEMSYVHPDGLNSSSYSVKLGNFRENEKVTINFPVDYEITGNYDDDLVTIVDYCTAVLNNTVSPITIRLSHIDGPVANIDFEPSDYIQPGENVSFDASHSTDLIGDIVNYTWDFDDGTKAYDEQVEHNWTTSGIKNVTLTIIDSSDLGDSAYKLITVDDSASNPIMELQNETGVIIITAGEDEEIWFNASKSTDTIDGQAEGEIFEYLWDFGEPEIGKSNQKVAVHKYNDPGFYNITLTVTDTAGNSKEVTITLEILDITRPAPSMSPNSGQIEVGENFTFDASDSTDNFDDLDNLTFSWDFDANLDSNGDGIKDNDYMETGVKINKSWPDYQDPITVLVNITDRAGNFKNITGYFTFRGTDLAINAKDFKVAPSTKVEKDEKVKIEVNITNSGIDSENVIVTFYVDDKEAGRKEIDFIAKNGFEVVEFSWKAKDEDKKHTFKVNVTLESYEMEENWLNNEHTYEIKVISGKIDPLIIVIVIVAIIAIVAILIYRKRTFGSFELGKRKKGDKKKGDKKKKGKSKSKKNK